MMGRNVTIQFVCRISHFNVVISEIVIHQFSILDGLFGISAAIFAKYCDNLRRRFTHQSFLIMIRFEY